MKRACTIAAALALFCLHAADAAQDSLRYGAFGVVHLYYQTKNPRNVVLFASGDGGWKLGVVGMAKTLSGLDAVIAGIDVPYYLRTIERSPEKCLYPAGDFEMLSKAVQQKLGFPEYKTPVLVGYSSGATLVYCCLVQAPSNTFKGAISMGFCPDLEITKPMCHGSGLEWRPGKKKAESDFLPVHTLEVPWIVLHGDADQVCPPAETQEYVAQVNDGKIVRLPRVGHGFAVERNWLPQFKQAFQDIVRETDVVQPAAPPAEIGDLPLIEVPPAAQPASDLLAVHYTGDGGWGITDKGIAQELSSRGIGVVGVNSLKYFWTGRTPESTAADLARIISYYRAAWKRSGVILIGYSFGADVMPFMINRLPQELRATVREVVLIGPGQRADFAFHLGSWLGSVSDESLPVLPEARKLKGMNIVCFYGSDDEGSLAPELASFAKVNVLNTGHRVGSNFGPIVAEILNALH
jgi:type IV secretory pathway VirJ component